MPIKLIRFLPTCSHTV